MASPGRGRLAAGSLRHPEPRFMGDAFRLRPDHRRPLRRARRRSSRDCRRHAAVVPVPLCSHADLGAARPRFAQYSWLLGRRFHAVCRPSPSRCFDGRRPRRDPILPVENCDPLSVEDAGRLEPERDGHPAPGRARRQRQGASPHSDRCRRARAADGLRERCESQPVQGSGTPARNRDPDGNWRLAAAYCPTASHREHHAGVPRRRGRPAVCVAVARRVEAGSATRHSAADGCST